MKVSMNKLYWAVGITKQGFMQWKSRYESREDKKGEVIRLVEQIRVDHPGTGVREVWRWMEPGIGRTKFENLAKDAGLQLVKRKNPMKTTNSKGVTHFDNLIEGIELKGVNQAWCSDITYYRLGEMFYYITLIMDLFSRRILGYHLSTSLETRHTTLPALKYALQLRRNRDMSRPMIFHSDGGGQYYEKNFRRLLENGNILSSMGKTCYENPKAERLNGIVKNFYLQGYDPKNQKDLSVKLARACINYNNRPHGSLGRKTPIEFEQMHQQKAA